MSRSILRTLAALGVVFAVTAAAAQSDELLEQGERLYQETAGGVGCAYCHGPEGAGDGAAGVGAPNIAGASESAIRSSIDGAVPVMNFIDLTESQLEAVAVYVQTLGEDAATEEAPAEEPPANGEGEPDEEESNGDGHDTGFDYETVNVELTSDGFEPARVTLPVDQRVALVVRNRTPSERHYRVVGMPVENLLWLDPAETDPEEGASDDALAEHDADAYVDSRAASPAGIQPNGEEVHAWTADDSAGGDKDVVVFTPTQRGTYEVVDPQHPDVTGQLVIE